jgi:hypothetical protein
LLSKDKAIKIFVNDAFDTAKFILKINVLKVEGDAEDLSCTCDIKKLTKNLKNNKITPMKVNIIHDTSISFNDANNSENIFEEQKNIDLAQTESNIEKFPEENNYIPIIMQMADLSNIVINLCILDGFAEFKTDEKLKKIFFFSKSAIADIVIEKQLAVPFLPEFKTTVITKILKIVTHAFNGPKTINLHIPTIPELPLKLSVSPDEKSSLNLFLFDQQKFL